MNLSKEQLSILQIWIQNNNSAGADSDSVMRLNTFIPFVVWKTSVSIEELQQDFDWGEVEVFDTGRARIWEWLFRFNTLNPSKENIRLGLDLLWGGHVVHDFIYSRCKRQATVAEELFAQGKGTSDAPATMQLEGLVTMQNVLDANAGIG